MNGTHTKARSIVAWIFGIYAAIVVLFNLPFMQHALANWTANALSRQLNTKVEIGSVNVGFLNSVIVKDLYVEDLDKKPMLEVARVSASINIFKLITSGQVDISSAQLFGTKANLYKKTQDDEPNFKFVIDAFKSDDKETKPINLRINSLIVRHANINYDVLSEGKKNTLDTNHLRIENAGFNLSLKQFTPDSLNATLKRCQAKELNSGLTLKELALKIEGNATQAKLSNFTLRLPSSTMEMDSVNIRYPQFSKDKSFAFSETNFNANITPSDFVFLSEKVKEITDNINLSTTLSGNNKSLDIKSLLLTADNDKIKTDLIAKVEDYTSSSPLFNVTVNNLSVSDGEIEKWASRIIENSDNLKPLFNIGSLDYAGNITKNKDGINSSGLLTTDAGSLTYEAIMSNDKLLDAEVKTTDINLGRIIENDDLGILNMDAKAIIDLAEKRDIPVGNIQSTINSVEYKGYNFSNINVDAVSNASDIKINAQSGDSNLDFTLDGTLTNILSSTKNIVANLDVHNINPHALNLTDSMNGENYSFNLTSDVNFTDINNLVGKATLKDITLTTADNNHSVENITIDANINGSSNQSLNINSDFLDANIRGNFKLTDLVNDFKNIVAYHMPQLIKHTPTQSGSDFNYDIKFYDAPIVHHFVTQNYSVEKPISFQGSLHSASHFLNLSCDAPKVTYNDNTFENLRMNCSSSNGNMMVTLEGGMNDDEAKTNGKIIAIAHNNKLDSDIQLHNKAKDNLDLNLFATTLFSNNNGNLMTNINIANSSLVINDSIWKINPSHISYCNKQVECNNFKIEKDNQYISINGKASPNSNDSLVVNLNDIEVAYILDLVNFHSVNFEGKASGRAIVNNIFGNPDANANLFVQDFSLQYGVMGDANILAHWDKEKDGIALNAHIVDTYKSQIGLTGTKAEFHGVTDVNGYILPTKKELSLNVLADNTRADFLNGYIGNIMRDIDGRLTGNIAVVGPFNDINLIGDPVADMTFTLNATKVPYTISADTVHLRTHSFDLEDVVLHDKQNNVGVLNGKIAHVNFSDFVYKFDIDITNLCAYNETEFNSDKFLAQVWANGDIHINGSDGHPMTIDANVTPCKGSVFAYDSATPDALVSNSFIDFHDITDNDNSTSSLVSKNDVVEERNDSIVSENDNYTYLGDLYMNVNVDLNPNCEIKLRMDNTKDGYISTFGNGTIQAKWYNKGAFQLFGNYNINSGKYRLYLQDLVYRNLNIQEGSKVEFNGNPFDANIHLICKHEINSVPLSDLTTTTAFSSNNKVKVDCFLDITGHLDNMDLNFSFELPNVSEETRQLVKSMINSDEEMNKQMIYLLGFQRFYPNELAQSNIEDYGTQAVNSLISSTISGQINQMLSNMIGSSSKWNFGTGITTGENGWQDLDVEGMLSGRLLNDRLLINGNFGYRDNSLTNQANFIGDFEVKYRIWESGDFFAKAYNQTNDRYFTKATLNTQGIGLSFQHDFEKYTLFNIFRKKHTAETDSIQSKTE